MASIQIKWHYINWEQNNTWAENIFPQLEHHFTEKDLKKAVYVIRIKNTFAIEYGENKFSPALYIGEGDFKTRLSRHKNKWLKDLIDLVGNIPLEIAITVPKVKNNLNVHKDVEADLIAKFSECYGKIPFFNKQNEYHYRDHQYNTEFKKPLTVGQGKKTIWILKPHKSNPYYKTYHQGNT